MGFVKGAMVVVVAAVTVGAMDMVMAVTMIVAAGTTPTSDVAG